MIDLKLIGFSGYISALKKLEADLLPSIAQANAETALSVAARAADNSNEYHDTGSETAGYYVEAPTAGVSQYDQAVTFAKVVNPRVEIVPKLTPGNKDSAVVGNVTGHFLFNEAGSVHNPVRAPLRRALEAERPKHGQRLQRRIRKAIKDAGLS